MNTIKSVLLLLMISYGFGRRFSSVASDNQVLWDNLIANQNLTRDIVFIGKNSIDEVNGYVYTQLQTEKANDQTIESVHQSMTIANTKTLYIIDNPDLKHDETKDLVTQIRKFNKADPIIIHSHKLMSNLGYNLFFVINSLHHSYDMFEICAYCDHGEDKFQKINSRIRSTGFKSVIWLPSSFKRNLYKRKLIVSSIVTPIILFPTGKNGQWVGSEYDIIELLGQKMNFEFDIQPDPKGLWGGVVNGKPVGVLGKVFSGEADLGAGGIGFSPSRAEYLDYSPATWISRYRIITDEPPKGLKFFSFLQPFSWSVWVLINLSTLIVALVLWVEHKLPMRSDDGKKLKSYWNCLWQINKIVLWDIPIVPVPSFSIMSILGLFMLSTFILINSYLGCLTSFTAILPYKWKPINTIEQLENSELLWLTRSRTSMTAFFSENSKLKAKMDIHPNNPNQVTVFKTYLQKMLDKPNTYCTIQPDEAIHSIMLLLFGDVNGNHKFHFSSQTIAEARTVIWMQKDAIYSKDFISTMLYIQAFGIQQHINLKHKEIFMLSPRKMAEKQNRQPDVKTWRKITLGNFTGMLVAIGVCYVTALIILVIEITINMRELDNKIKYFYLTKILRKRLAWMSYREPLY